MIFEGFVGLLMSLMDEKFYCYIFSVSILSDFFWSLSSWISLAHYNNELLLSKDFLKFFSMKIRTNPLTIMIAMSPVTT